MICAKTSVNLATADQLQGRGRPAFGGPPPHPRPWQLHPHVSQRFNRARFEHAPSSRLHAVEVRERSRPRGPSARVRHHFIPDDGGTTNASSVHHTSVPTRTSAFLSNGKLHDHRRALGGGLKNS